MPNEALEPKVAKLEVAVDSVTKDLASLTGIVRELAQGVQKQWQQTETQYSQLLVAVERAAAPRKTDWHLVLGSVGLILAIGAAAFSPMMMRSNDLQAQVNKTQEAFEKHAQLKLHPVGESRIDAIEADLKERNTRNTDLIRELDAKLQKEYQLIELSIKDRVASLEAQHRADFAQLLKRIEDSVPDMQKRLAVLEVLRAESIRLSGQPAAPGIVR